MDAPQERKLLCRALFFEQWLRFRFLCEKEDTEAGICLRVPEAERSELMACHPELVSLLDRLDGTEPDAAAAQAAIVDFSRARLGEDATHRILRDPDFQAAVLRFQQRVENEADTLDAEISFPCWLELFETPRSPGEG